MKHIQLIATASRLSDHICSDYKHIQQLHVFRALKTVIFRQNTSSKSPSNASLTASSE